MFLYVIEVFYKRCFLPFSPGLETFSLSGSGLLIYDFLLYIFSDFFFRNSHHFFPQLIISDKEIHETMLVMLYVVLEGPQLCWTTVPVGLTRA